MVLHCADIGHPAKEWKLHYKWTKQLLEEFFTQGDREKELGLPISPLCDRTSVLVAESQIGKSRRETKSLLNYSGTCLIQHPKRPGKYVGLYRMP